MPPYLALSLAYAVIAWLMRRDFTWRSHQPKTTLVPAIFLGIIASRQPSHWLGWGGGTNLEGNPVNTAFFAIILVTSLLMLQYRCFNWHAFLASNKVLVLIYTFFVVSASWSEEPAVCIKRVIKDFICVLVALIIVTEKKPAENIKALFVRVAYVLFCLSWVFGKYFPAIGRSSSRAGEVLFTGVTTQKNSLGETVFVFGLIIIWELFTLRSTQPKSSWLSPKRINVGLLLLGLWLLITCDSKTSLLCLIVGTLSFFIASKLRRLPNGKFILFSGLIATTSVTAADKYFHISERILALLDRNPTLTGRTDIWEMTLQNQTDPILGGGFYMFWDSERGRAVIDKLVTLNSAHNGYLEVYIDGGIIGCILLGILLLSIGFRVISRVFSDHPLGALGFAFWTTSIIYNFSESSFFRLDPLWFSLLLTSVEVPFQQEPQPSRLETSFMTISTVGGDSEVLRNT